MEASIKSGKHWLEWLLGQDRRRSERWPSPRLAVYYWSGWTSSEHSVRDISSTGVYLLTDADWSPGVRVLLTLQRKELSEESLHRWIGVEGMVVRCSSDGVALSFVPSGRGNSLEAGSILEHGANRKELDRFLFLLFKDDKAHLVHPLAVSSLPA